MPILGATDANDIPNRSAFEWYKSDKGPGMAYWYNMKGPWKEQFNNDIPNDGISLEEEVNEPNSIWTFYRDMISIRKSNPVISGGAYQTLNNDNDHVFTFMRYKGTKKLIVAVNLSADPQTVYVKSDLGTPLNSVYGHGSPKQGQNGISVHIPAYGIEVWRN